MLQVPHDFQQHPAAYRIKPLKRNGEATCLESSFFPAFVQLLSFSESIFTLCNVNDHVKQVFKSRASLWLLKTKACTAMIRKQQSCVDFDKLIVLITLCGKEFTVSLDVTCKNISLCRFWMHCLISVSLSLVFFFFYSLKIHDQVLPDYGRHITHYFTQFYPFLFLFHIPTSPNEFPHLSLQELFMLLRTECHSMKPLLRQHYFSDSKMRLHHRLMQWHPSSILFSIQFLMHHNILLIFSLVWFFWFLGGWFVCLF